MRKGYFWILLIIMVFPLRAQSGFDLIESREGKIIVIPRQAKFNFNFPIPEVVYQSYTPSSTHNLDFTLTQFQPDYHPTSLSERPMDMQVLSEAYAPFFNVYTPMLRRISPMAFDFRETSITPLNDQFTFFVVGEQYTWPGSGGITTVTPAVSWHSNGFTLTGNAFGGRYYTPFNNSPKVNVGAGLHAQYDINERMTVKAWGQYAHYFGDEKQNPHMLINPFYNHTSVGGAFEVKISEHVGVGVGVNYEYNPRHRRMEPQYLIYPVFKNDNIQIKFW